MLTVDLLNEVYEKAMAQQYEPDHIVIHPNMVLPMARAMRSGEYHNNNDLRNAFVAGYIEGRKIRPLKRGFTVARRSLKAFWAYCEGLAAKDIPDHETACSYLFKKDA